MNIQQAAWAPIVFPLDGLAQTISAVNYTVQFETLQFSFEGSAEMTLEDLQKLYPNYPVAGKLEPCSFIDAQKLVHYCLSYHVKGSIPEYDPQSDLTMARFLTFWNLIKEMIEIPTTQVYIHKPDFNSHFHFGTTWNFCIVLIHGTQGLVISGNAFD